MGTVLLGLGRMAPSTGSRGLRLRLFRLHLLVAVLTPVVECHLKIELLLIGWEFHFSLGGRFGVTFLTFLNLIALFPDILAIFKYMMALVAGDLVLSRMLFMAELHRRLGQSGPNRRFDGDCFRHLLRSHCQ